MEVVRIFDDESGNSADGLYSIKYNKNGKNEYDKFIDIGDDVQGLFSFFKENLDDLNNPIYEGINLHSAVMQTIDEVREIERGFLEMKKSGDYQNLQILFKPLNDLDGKIFQLQKSKSKAKLKKVKHPWVRIYAIRIDKSAYVITGSAIKLTKGMKEREHTKKELDKFDKALNFLKVNGILSTDDIIYYYDNIEE